MNKKVDDEKKFRKDMFKSKRKQVDEIWTGRQIPGVSEIVRFVPSACHTQPWIVENTDCCMNVYRYKKEGKRGIMPADKVSFYNQIDVGIFLCLLDLCLQHNGIEYTTAMHIDCGTDTERTKVATYYFDDFASLLGHPKSLVRNRVLHILAANANHSQTVCESSCAGGFGKAAVYSEDIVIP